jgi:hypothetical protein
MPTNCGPQNVLVAIAAHWPLATGRRTPCAHLLSRQNWSDLGGGADNHWAQMQAATDRFDARSADASDEVPNTALGQVR